MARTYKEKANQVYSMPTAVSDLDSRLDLINDVLEDGYFEDYVSNNYNPNLVASSPLSNDNPNFKLLERIADYIMMSDEGKELNKNDSDNRAITTEYLNKKIRREHVKGFEGVGTTHDKDIPLAYEPYKNQYDLSRVEVTDDDIKQNQALKEYKNIYDNIDNVDRFSKRYKDFIKHEIMSDMIAIKNNDNVTKSNKGYAQKTLYNNGDRYDFLDFTDPKTVKQMLYISNVNPTTQHNLYLATLDFRAIIDKIDLNQEELYLFNLLQSGISYVEMEREFGLDQIHYRKVVRKNLINKIVSYGETYDKNDSNSILFEGHD